MQVYLIKISTMGGSKLHSVAFESERVAKTVALGFNQEWQSGDVVLREGEEIPGGRVLVDDHSYKLDRTTSEEHLRKTALSKLSAEEKKALGVKP
jgi:hypothetical protein